MREQTHSVVRGHRMLDGATARGEKERVVSPRVASRVFVEIGRLVTVQIRGCAAKREKMSHQLRIVERSLHIHRRPARERRVAVLGDHLGERAREALLFQMPHRIGEPSRRGCELRRGGRTHVVKRIPLEGEEAKVRDAITAPKCGEESRHPWVARGVLGPCHHRLALGALKTRTAQRRARSDIVQRAGPAKVERGVVLWCDVLAIRLLAQLHAIVRVPSSRKKAKLVRAIFGSREKDGHRHHHGKAIGKSALRHTIEAGLLEIEIDVGGAMPRVRGRRIRQTLRGARGAVAQPIGDRAVVTGASDP